MSDISLPGASAKITGDSSGLRSAVGQAQTALAALEPVVARQWWGLQNLSKAFGAFGSFVAGGFGIAIKEAISWESAMVGVQRTTGASGVELADLEAKLRKVAETTPIAVSELAALAEQAGALGIANTDIPEFVRVLGNLIASTNLTTADVDDLARVLNILQVPVESFDRFASTLLEVGRNTAATETEILSMAKRFAPAAQAAGVLADEVLAISAAVLSLGPRAEAGGSAVNRTFADIATAIATDNDELKIFAALSGKSVEEFSRFFQLDPAHAFAAVVTGLGSINGGYIEQEKILRSLGITEVRQQQALIALADGTQAQGSEQSDLNAILDLAHKAWRDNTALVEVAHQRYGTTAAQITILRNQIAELGNTIGKALLPPIKFMIGLLQDLLAGFQSLPGPIQFVFASLVALLGGLSLLAGGVLALIGPIVLAFQTWRTLSKALGEVRVGAIATVPPLQEDAAAVQQVGATAVVAAEQLSFFTTELKLNQGAAASGATQLSLFSAQTGKAAVGAAEVGVATSTAASTGLARFSKAGAVIAGVLGLVTVGLTLFGHHARESADATDDATKADLGLVDALDAQRKGQKGVADEWLLQQITMAGAIDTANTLGGELWGLVDVLNVIKGTASFEQAKAIIDTIKAAADAGDEKAKSLLDFMIKNTAIWRESESAAGQLSNARGELGIATDAAASAEGDLGDQTEETTKKQEKQNQATIDLIDALMGEAQAAFNVKDAQEAYAKAVADAKDPTQATAEAEGKLAQARNDAAKAQEDLAGAEKKLADARKQQWRDLADAQSELIDARDKYLDSLDRIAEAEDKVAKLREGPSLKEITDATNKLADAQLKLRHSEQSVADAEFELAYLRGEGASGRAIKDAELALDDARQGVKDQTQEVSDAEAELEKLRAGADPEELAKAERDLDKARRDSISALRDIADDEARVKEIRDQIANDTAYKNAQADVVVAQNRVYDALKSVTEAETELAKIRAGSLADNVAKAELDLEQALVAQAKATTEAQKQQAALRGEFWDTGTEAQKLADNLEGLLNQAPTPEARQRLQDYIDTLRQAVPTGDAANLTPEDIIGNVPSNSDIADYIAKQAESGGGGGGESILDRIMNGLFSGGTGAGIGGIAGGILGTIFGPEGTIAGFIVGSLIGSVVGGLIDEFWPEISGFFSRLGGYLGQNIPKWFGGIADFFKKLPGRIIGFITDLPGMIMDFFFQIIEGGISFVGDLGSTIFGFFASLPEQLAYWLGFAVGTIVKYLFLQPIEDAVTYGPQLVETVMGFIISLPGLILQGLEALPGLISELFTTVGSTMFNLTLSFGGMVIDWFTRLPGLIGDIVSNLPGQVIGWFSNIGSSLWNAFRNAADDLLDWFQELPSKIWNAISDLASSVLGWFADIGHSLWDGFWDAVSGSPKTKIEYTLEDINSAMGSTVANMRDSLRQLDQLHVDPFKDLAAQFAADPITASVSAQFTGDAAMRGMAANQAAFGPTWGAIAPDQTVDNSQQRGGDTFQITGADERTAVDIAEEVMFKKLVRT